MWVAVALLLLAAAAAPPALGATSPLGVYLYSEHLATDSLQFAQAIALDGVDGITLLQNWNELEPSQGRFHWTGLDDWIGLAQAQGRNVVLAIRAGGNTPCWLFGPDRCGSPKTYAGATPLDFLVSPRQGLGQTTCDSITIAAPWDPVFLAQWDSLLTHVASHLRSVNEYDAVVGVRLTGINRTTAELRLPEEILGAPCATNSIETWLAASPPYRPDSLRSAWDRITDSFGRAFPDKPFGLELVPDATGNASYPLPEIDAAGCVYTSVVPASEVPGACTDASPMPDDLWPLVQLAAQKFPGRLTLSFQNLDHSLPANPYVVQAAQTLGTGLGFQTNDYDSLQDAACGGGSQHPVACDSLSYLELLGEGIYPLGESNPLRAEYIEVLAPDALQFPWSIRQAHDRLTGAPAGAPPPLEPLAVMLAPPAPDPATASATLRYVLAQPVRVTLELYDVRGARVATLLDAPEPPGAHQVRLGTGRFPSGLYFLQLRAGNRAGWRKLTIAK